MKKIFYAIAMFVALVSCDNETVTLNEKNSNTSDQMIIYASLEDGLTKTALSGNDTDGYQVVWTAGDQITIGGASHVFTLTSGAGTTSGEFALSNGTKPSDGTYDALYRTAWKTLPETQLYNAGTIKYAPMHATVTVTGGEAGDVKFRNLCGLLRLTVSTPATKILKSITVSADQYLAGPYNISDYAAVIDTKDLTKVSKSVKLDCEKGVSVSQEGTVFYIALPQGSFSNVAITLTDMSDVQCIKRLKGKDLVIERAKITPASFTASNFNAFAGHEFVDLGLPSGTLWATCNVGANTPEESGNYFAWGETVQKESFTTENYTKPEETTLTPEHDAAHVNWGGGWRMPTQYDAQELINNCCWICYGMSGFLVYKPKNDTDKGKIYFHPTDAAAGYDSSADPHIFFPMAGYMNKDEVQPSDEVASYWTASIVTDKYTCSFGANNKWTHDKEEAVTTIGACYPHLGLPVRAVHNAPVSYTFGVTDKDVERDYSALGRDLDW